MTNTTTTTSPSPSFDQEVLNFMRQQEMESYSLPRKYWEVAFQDGTISLLPDDNEDQQDAVDQHLDTYLTWRNQMITWFLQVQQSCQYELDTCEIALNMVDRYMAYSPDGHTIMKQSEQYQLICMTCLYMAAKVHETLCLRPFQLETLSCQRFTTVQFETTECHILKTLQWHVHPPTATSFARNLIALLPNDYY